MDKLLRVTGKKENYKDWEKFNLQMDMRTKVILKLMNIMGSVY